MLTSAERLEILRRQHHRCGLCLRPKSTGQRFRLFPGPTLGLICGRCLNRVATWRSNRVERVQEMFGLEWCARADSWLGIDSTPPPPPSDPDTMKVTQPRESEEGLPMSN